jgi:hypothetical protein
LAQVLATQRERLAQARWPEPGAAQAELLLERLAERLPQDTAPAPATAEELQELRELVDAAVTALEHYERDRSWARLEPGDPAPEGRFTERLGSLLSLLATSAAQPSP